MSDVTVDLAPVEVTVDVVDGITVDITETAVTVDVSGDVAVELDVGIVQLVTSGGTIAVRTIATDSLVLAANRWILVDTSSGVVTATLPVVLINGQRHSIKRTGGNSAVVATSGSETIDGSSTITLTRDNESIEVVCDGSNWHIFG